MEHRTEFNTTIIDIVRDAVRVHFRCTGCDLWGQFDVSPAANADRLITVIDETHSTPDLFAAQSGWACICPPYRFDANGQPEPLPQGTNPECCHCHPTAAVTPPATREER